MNASELELQPLEILYSIGLNLPYLELIKYCQLSTKFRQICQNPAFWAQKGQKDFGTFLYMKRVGIPKSHEEYRQIYLVYHCLPGAEKYTKRCLSEVIKLGKEEHLDYFLANIPAENEHRSRVNGGLYQAAKSGKAELIFRILNRMGEFNSDELQELANGLGEYGDLNLINEFRNKGIMIKRNRLIEGAIRGNHLDLIQLYMPPRLSPDLLFYYLELSIGQNEIWDYLFNYFDNAGYQLRKMQLKILIDKAAKKGNLNIIKELIKRGPDESAIGSLLGYAGINGHWHILDYMLTTQLVTPKALTYALIIAANHNNSGAIKWLRAHGATNLHAVAYGAALGGHLDLFLKAINEGAIIDKQLFIAAAKWGHLHILKYLAEFFDLATFNESLLAAAKNINTPSVKTIVSYLISLGANNLEQALLVTAQHNYYNVKHLLALIPQDQLTRTINSLLITNLLGQPDLGYVKLLIDYGNQYNVLDNDYVIDLIKNATGLGKRHKKQLIDYVLPLQR